MELMDYSRFALSLGFVILLIWGIAAAMKKFGLDKRLRGVSGQVGRLKVVDVLYMDTKRKLMLVRADAQEYLLLVSGDSVTVVDKLGEKKNDA